VGFILQPYHSHTMAYKRSYRRRRAPFRRKRRASRYAPRRKRTYRRRSAPGGYRQGIPRQIGMQNMNPNTVTVQFVQKEVYTVTGVTGIGNSGSIIQVPVSDLVAPQFNPPAAFHAEGTWTFPGFNAFLPRFRHYVVRGAKVQARCVPVSNDPSNKKNKMYTQLVSDHAAVAAAATTERLFEAFNATEKNWHNSGNEVGAYDYRNYSPAKVWHIPKSNVMGKSDLKCNVGSTDLPGAAPDRTFVSVSLKGYSDNATQPHDTAMLTIKATYLVTFMEHIGGASSTTTLTNVATGGQSRKRFHGGD